MSAEEEGRVEGCVPSLPIIGVSREDLGQAGPARQVEI